MTHQPSAPATTDADKTTPEAVTAEGQAYPSARLRYVDVPRPAPGKVVEVAPGVLWCRIPLPIDLDHINVWLLDTVDGCVLVDTGMAAPIGKAAWESIQSEVLSAKPLRGIFITHIHPDHIGLAAWLQQRHKVPVLMSRRTHELAQILFRGQHVADATEPEAFFRSHGVTDIGMLQPMFSPSRFAKMMSGMPEVSSLVADGEILEWGTMAWTAMQTDGHAEGHLCLSASANRLLISGDQVLPTISSNIGFTWRNSDRNPLHSYLTSLQRLRALSTDTLVLPSHGLPFYGLQHRIDDLTHHHEEQLDMLVKACIEPRTAVDVLPLLFRRALNGLHMFLAMAEALAHLEYLAHAGRVERRKDAQGVIRYASDMR